MKILIINLSTGEKRERELFDPLMAGRYLSGTLVTEFVDPKTDPLGPGNALVLTTGVLANSRTSTGSRLVRWLQKSTHQRHQGIQCGWYGR